MFTFLSILAFLRWLAPIAIAIWVMVMLHRITISLDEIRRALERADPERR